ITGLKTQNEILDSLIRRLAANMWGRPLVLLLPDEDVYPEAQNAAGVGPGVSSPVPDAQRIRVHIQATTIIEILKAKRERNGKVLEYLEQAKDICDGGTPATQTAVRIADRRV
ncbi:unnamed protein product, partial [Sphacelaria rigidula]